MRLLFLPLSLQSIQFLPSQQTFTVHRFSLFWSIVPTIIITLYHCETALATSSPSKNTGNRHRISNRSGKGTPRQNLVQLATTTNPHDHDNHHHPYENYDDDDTHPIQKKLLAMWECLMFPASERLEFMRKYSLPPFSQKLGNAVDMWCEAAVLVKTRKQLTAIFEAVAANSYRLPLRVRDVMDRIREELPTELLSYNPVFLPLAQNPTAEALKLSR